MTPLALSRKPDSLYYQVEDRRDCRTTCHHRALACLRHLRYVGTWARRMVCPDQDLGISAVSNRTGKYELRKLPWNSAEAQESRGLCLMIHGLNSSPKQWESYTRQFRKEFPNAHLVVGSVHKAGNCSLQDAANPFVELVENYMEKCPGKPIVFIGTSNGARVAADVESRVNPEGLKSLTSFSVAGVLGGSKVVDWAHKFCRCLSRLHHPAIKRDLSSMSQESQALVSALQQRQVVWKRQGAEVSHYFIATTEDEKVRPLDSSLPYLEGTPKENYWIEVGESHETIVDAVQEKIFQIMRPILR
ncbi:MAG: hypothetical protein JSS32_02265 [Verrucomicrobia bacterium]|nr:hypothetical protein [Verrucomicrobiota bacterium]